MSTHINTGIRKILENPLIYNLFHNITGGNAFRKQYFSTYFTLTPGSRVLDIGCGSGVMLANISSDIEYYGVDFEASYIAYCREHYGDRGTFIHQKVGDELRTEWFDHFDAINAHGLLHHLSNEDGAILLETAHKYLKKGGYLVTFDSAYYADQPAHSRWLVSKDRGQNVKEDTAYQSFAEHYFDQVEGRLYTNYSRLPYAAYAMKMTK